MDFFTQTRPYRSNSYSFADQKAGTETDQNNTVNNTTTNTNNTAPSTTTTATPTTKSGWNISGAFGALTPKKNLLTSLSSFGEKIKTFVTEEQQMIARYLAEQKENERESETKKEEPKILPPWLDLPSDLESKIKEEIQSQIMNLTKAKRNFLNAPEDPSFPFDFDTYLPIAMASLKADPVLANARFYLVPKYIREPQFWRNYFYRVYLIKQAYGVPTTPSSLQPQLAQQTPTTSNEPIVSTSAMPIPSINTSVDAVPIDRSRSSSTAEGEFVSDQMSPEINVNLGSLQKELGQLGVSPSNPANWEAVLRQELEKDTLGSSPSNDVIIDEAWEEQMKKELEEEL